MSCVQTACIGPTVMCTTHALLCLQGDISAGKMLFGIEGVDPARRQVELRAGQLQVAEFR